MAFGIYLRTGRIAAPAALETKFNPWHDPDDGRFTFAGQGRYFQSGNGQARSGNNSGPGSRSGAQARETASARARTAHTRQNDPKNPRNYSIYLVKRGDTLTKIAAFRRGLTVADLEWLNEFNADGPLKIGQRIKLPHQQFLDAGKRARDTFIALAHYMEITGGKLPPDVARPPSIEVQIEASGRRDVEANGYGYEIDVLLRTRNVSGEIRLRTESRSRSAQSNAGKPDRRPTDDGGHFIAARFNGPREWFNHFAQDANFNRGAYRTLEDDWAKAVRSGKRVFVDIVPHYRGASMRPYKLTVVWYVDGSRRITDSTTKREADNMAEESFNALGPMLAEIGGVAAKVVGGDADGLYLYVEVGDRWISASLFKDEGSVVRYYDPSSDLSDLIYEFWQAERPDRRWAVMEYEVNGTKFDADFKFPDEVDVESFETDRRGIALKSRYGDKPVVYPPWPFEASSPPSE